MRENAKVYNTVVAVRCCRIWPVVDTTTTVSEKGVKKEQWWWRTCGLCGEYPVRITEDRP